ncbi:hypothetical protein ACH436_15010 [Isoptericola sp. NPDC019693]|uniref:hypothetical protein n=1 Tax=Isoptericola sp. NPDC019693 TaxID=3364009 RepID=UPI0037923E6B
MDLRTARGGRRPSARAVVLAALASAALLVLGVGVTSAGFTDQAEATLGADGTLGGSYDIAFLDGDGELQQGDPDAWVVDTADLGVVPVIGQGEEPSFTVHAVTTTAATGPVVLTLVDPDPSARAADPGIAGDGAEPFDVALFTVAVDGEVVAQRLTAAEIADAGLTIASWERDMPRSITVAMALPAATGNPYYFGRAFQVGLVLEGMTS